MAIRSSLSTKVLFILLFALLASVAAVFLYFAITRQSHPQNGPAQNTGRAVTPRIVESFSPRV